MIGRIETTKQFLKHYKQRVQGNMYLEKRVKERINIFLTDRFSPILRDHALVGKHRFKRSFSISGDVRIVYRETISTGEIAFLFLDIGTHNQVY